MPVLEPAGLLGNRVEAVRKYHEDRGIERAELDLSGGIDSAVMAGILVLALGAENVTLAHLGINTNPVQTDRATRLAAALGCKLAVGDFTDIYDRVVSTILQTLDDAGFDYEDIQTRMLADPTICGSIRSTLRAPLGRAYNRITGGGIRHGTGNECEDRFLRFYQKGGDGEVDSNPIAMLSKAEVYQLAYELATGYYFPIRGVRTDATGALLGDNARVVYFETIGAIPSADLWGTGDQHTDENEISKWLGASFTYGKLDVTTGKVVNVGTIERVSRFLDERVADSHLPTWQEQKLFGDSIRTKDMSAVLDAAMDSNAFKGSGLDMDSILHLLMGARKAERQTRHKHNPAIPMMGSRVELIRKGIVTDDFAVYGTPEVKVVQTAATVA